MNVCRCEGFERGGPTPWLLRLPASERASRPDTHRDRANRQPRRHRRCPRGQELALGTGIARIRVTLHSTRAATAHDLRSSTFDRRSYSSGALKSGCSQQSSGLRRDTTSAYVLSSLILVWIGDADLALVDVEANVSPEKPCCQMSDLGVTGVSDAEHLR